ncbi:MAG: hypothetical protein ACOH16_02970 [Propionibacteriaceae bacterium]
MMRRQAGAALCLVLVGCTSPAVPVAEAPTSGPATARTTAAAATTTAATTALADRQIPTSCGLVTDAEHLGRLGVTTTATPVYTDPAATAMPTTEAQAQEEDRTWPGLGCLYASPEAEQEARILVMPDTSPFFTTRQTTTCLPTYGKGTKVNLGSVTGYYCPTTNETPGESVSFVHHGRLVTVSRTSTPTGDSPYQDVLISYATWLAQRV